MNLRSLVQLLEEVLRYGEELVQISTSFVLHGHRNTILNRETRNHWRAKCQDLGIFNRSRLLVNHTQNRIGFQRIYKQSHQITLWNRILDTGEEATGTLIKRLQLDDESSLIRPLSGNEVIANNRFAPLNGRITCQHLIYFVNDFNRSFLACSRISRYHYEQRSRIFIGHKPCFCGRHRNDQSHYSHCNSKRSP